MEIARWVNSRKAKMNFDLDMGAVGLIATMLLFWVGLIALAIWPVEALLDFQRLADIQVVVRLPVSQIQQVGDHD